MPALMLPRAPPLRRENDSPLVRVLEAYIETLRAENEILKRQLAAAEARAGRETANAQQAIAEFSAITNGSGRGRSGSRDRAQEKAPTATQCSRSQGFCEKVALAPSPDGSSEAPLLQGIVFEHSPVRRAVRALTARKPPMS
jgi:hypothetical protein